MNAPLRIRKRNSGRFYGDYNYQVVQDLAHNMVKIFGTFDSRFQAELFIDERNNEI